MEEENSPDFIRYWATNGDSIPRYFCSINDYNGHRNIDSPRHLGKILKTEYNLPSDIQMINGPLRPNHDFRDLTGHEEQELIDALKGN